MHHKSLVLAAIGLLAVAPLTGCGEDPQQAGHRLETAIATVAQAHRGYVPADSSEQADTPGLAVAEHRLQMLEQAAGDLREVAARGTREQQVAARRLLADIHAAAARAQYQEAGTQFGALALRASAVLNHLATYEQAHGRYQRFDRDATLTLEQINEEIREQRATREQAQARRQRLQGQSQRLQTQLDELRQNADAGHAQARRLRDQAFVAEGTQQYDLEEQADQLTLEAEKQAIQTEQLALEVEFLQADMALAEQQTASIDRLIEQLQAQVRKIEQQAGQLAAQRGEIQTDRNEALNALREEFEQLTSTYHAAVHSRFEQAHQRAEEAVTEAREAANNATGSERSHAQGDLLARQVEQTQGLVDQVSALGSFGRVLQVVVTRMEQLQPDQARPFQSQFNELVEQQSRLIEQARQAMEPAQTLAAELANDSDASGEAARWQLSRLNTLNGRLREASLE